MKRKKTDEEEPLKGTKTQPEKLYEHDEETLREPKTQKGNPSSPGPH